VFEGEGFLSAIKRGVLTGLLHATRRQEFFHVHGTEEALLKAMRGDEAAAPLSRLLSMAREKGYLDPGMREFGPRSRAP
jgi:hypothetical protein